MIQFPKIYLLLFYFTPTNNNCTNLKSPQISSQRVLLEPFAQVASSDPPSFLSPSEPIFSPTVRAFRLLRELFCQRYKELLLILQSFHLCELVANPDRPQQDVCPMELYNPKIKLDT